MFVITIIFLSYTLETHYVKTEDDYILKIFRIPYSKEKSIRHRNHNEEINHYKKGVLLVHGLIVSIYLYIII